MSKQKLNPCGDRPHRLGEFLGNLAVGESEHGETTRLEMGSSGRFVPILVRHVIDLDDQFRLESGEIGDPMTEWNLAAKARPGLPILDGSPETGLTDGELVSQVGGSSCSESRVWWSGHLASLTTSLGQTWPLDSP